MSLWVSRLCGYWPCCPGVVNKPKRRPSRPAVQADIQLENAAVVSSQPGDVGSVISVSGVTPQVVYKQFANDPYSELDAEQLHDLLNTHKQTELLCIRFPFEGFSYDTCRAMLATRDIDQSGKMGFREFQELIEDLHVWLEVFEKHDLEKQGYFDKAQFAEIIQETTGMALSERTVKALSVRYSDKEGRVNFGDFVAAAVRLKLMLETWQGKSEPQKSETCSFSSDEFIQLTMYG